MTASESSDLDARIGSVRLVRRVKAAPLLALLSALGLALLMIFGMTTFAQGAVESVAARAAREALDGIGASWVRVSASGQWVELSGAAPSQAEAVRAVEVVRKAKAGAMFASAQPVTKVSQVFTWAANAPAAMPAGPATQARPASPPATPASPTSAPSPSGAATPAPPQSVTQPAPTSAPGPSSAELCDHAFADLLAARNIEFPEASAAIPADDLPFLDSLARVAKGCPGVLAVNGYTDSSGSDTLNKGLSLQRAEAVRKALIDRGLPAARVVAAGLGDKDPVASNLTEVGRDRNRRIEILVQPPGN